MRSSYKALAALCSLALSVNTGCNGSTSSGDIPGNDSAPLSVGDTSDTSDTEVSGTFHTVTDKELSPSTESASAVSFTADGAECTGKGVSASGSTVTITEPGSYSVSGSCNDGQLIINCSKDDDVYLVLNGLSLTCPDGPAILCEQADKLTITLNSSSVNTLSDGSEYTAESGEDTGAALFSRDTLIINGTGSLVVNGVYKDGIKSKDGLKLCGGNITVNSAEDGLVGKDYVLAAAGNVTINSGLDGLKSTNSTDAQKGYISVTGGKYDITCGNDGIQAESALSISDGEINIVSGGGSETVEHLPEQQGGFGRGQRGDQFTDGSEPFDFSNMTNADGSSADSMKGIKSNGTITVSGGIINANCADDAVHSDGNVTISGGKLNLSTGDDGIHAGSVLTINNGEINITESYEGLEAPGIEIIGGTISLMASDDGINAGSSTAETGFTPYITISGGSITANANGDGIDSNGTVSMSGGTLVVFGPTSNGNGALDYDKSFAMSGGTLIALGSRGMAQAPSTLSQPCLSIYSSVSADSVIEVRNSDGNVMISTITPKQCESLIFSSPDFISGNEYKIYANDVLLSTVTATDGVSGGGASGTGSGSWGQDGGDGWAPQKPGGDKPGTRPDKPRQPISA